MNRARAKAKWDAATPEQRQRMRVHAGKVRGDRKRHPLAYVKLWDRPTPRTSQLRSIRNELTSGKLYRFILGGSRSGKSEGAAIVDMCYALGVDHPDVERFLRRNGIDPAKTDIPKGPGVVWAVACDSNDSRRYVRPKIRRYQPKDSKWRNEEGNGEAEVTFPGGGRIVFKTVDQGRDGFQGDAVRRVHFDEEPNDLAVVGEAAVRIVDQRGHLGFSMTPLSGWTSLLELHIRDPHDDVIVQWIHGADNPYVPPEMLRKVFSRAGAHERAARERGEITALEGRIYTDWSRELHVVPSFPIPSDWTRFAAVDFGTRNPTAIAWAALDPRDDVLHLYREHYRAEMPQEWQAGQYLALTGAEDIMWVVADPEDTASRMTWATYGVHTIPAWKGPGSVRAGISAMASRLALDAGGKPHLVVHDCCPMFIREVESYVWANTKTKRDLPDEPLKKGDHLLDAVRYLIHRIARLGDLYRLDEVEKETAS